MWIRIRGSMPLTNGSGSCSFCHWPSRRQQITNLKNKLLFEGTFTSFCKDKKSKRSQNSMDQCFSYYFCLMIEGSGSRSLPLTNGTGWPKNMWIRIRNTTLYLGFLRDGWLLCATTITLSIQHTTTPQLPSAHMLSHGGTCIIKILGVFLGTTTSQKLAFSSPAHNSTSAMK